MSLLDRIDNTIAGDICPCGAQPRAGSAYCSEDCVPNYHARHTTSDTDGTQMRWRPDLVTAVDDSGLELVCANVPRGRFNGTMYRRADTGALHLRLDDGHRWAGCDVPGADVNPQHVLDGWARLDQELTDQRRVDPDRWERAGDPWSHLETGRHERRTLDSQQTFGWQRRCLHCGERNLPLSGMRPGQMRIDVLSFGSDEPVAQLPDYEQCDLCGNCRRQFPGPPLQVTRTDRRDADMIEFRMRIGDRKAGWRVTAEHLVRMRHPEEMIQQRLERLEIELLVDYARANPDRPDVIDWAEAYQRRAENESRLHMQRLGPVSELDSETVRSLVRGLNWT